MNHPPPTTEECCAILLYIYNYIDSVNGQIEALTMFVFNKSKVSHNQHTIRLYIQHGDGVGKSPLCSVLWPPDQHMTSILAII